MGIRILIVISPPPPLEDTRVNVYAHGCVFMFVILPYREGEDGCWPLPSKDSGTFCHCHQDLCNGKTDIRSGMGPGAGRTKGFYIVPVVVVFREMHIL